MIRLILICLAWIAAAPVWGEEVVAGLSQNRVSITANFDGSEILIFGAVKRQEPPPDAGDLQVIITVAGPDEPVVVRRKEKRAGIWMNIDAVEVDAAPSFYAVATTDLFRNALSHVDDLRHQISVPRAIRSVGAPPGITDAENFTAALIRIRENKGLYQLQENSVNLTEDTLFDARITLPANLTEGAYRTRIFLTRDRQVIAQYETDIQVQKVGLERFLYNLAHERPLVYGIMSLVIAIAAGWTASAVFTYIRS